MPIPTIIEPVCQKDIIYFVLTDRFYNPGWEGPPPPGHASDREKPYRYHGGNFAGIEMKIPYLVQLGITALWISPVYLSIGSFLGQDGYHGYWALDFDRLDPHLASTGEAPDSKADLARLVDKLHSNGIKVILDMVVNHTGYHTPHYYQETKLPPHWFKKKEDWDLFGLPQLDHRLADVRDYFVNNITDWLEATGVDAIRMDSVPHVDHEFWYYFKAYVRGKYRHIFFLGEDLDFDEDVISAYQREHDFDSLFDFPLRRNIIDVLIRNEDFKPAADRMGMAAIASPRLKKPGEQRGVLDADTKYNNANRLVTLLDNHDLEKRVMSWAEEYSQGDLWRAALLVKYVLSFQFTTRGIPQIYYGTEIGMCGDQDNDGDAAIRRDMEWDKIDPDTGHPRSEFPVAGQIYDHLKKLIELRKNNEALSYGYLFTLFSDYNTYVFMREYRGNTFIVALNNTWQPCRLVVDIGSNNNLPSRIKQNLSRVKVLVNVLNSLDTVTYEAGLISLSLAGKTSAIYRLTI